MARNLRKQREPPVGIEPTTYALRGRRLTAPPLSSTNSTPHSSYGTHRPARTLPVMPEVMPGLVTDARHPGRRRQRAAKPVEATADRRATGGRSGRDAGG
jgi:hypothetical protein